MIAVCTNKILLNRYGLDWNKILNTYMKTLNINPTTDSRGIYFELQHSMTLARILFFNIF